jgi:hypothetical protein
MCRFSGTTLENSKRRSSARTPKRKRGLERGLAATFWTAVVLHRFSSRQLGEVYQFTRRIKFEDFAEPIRLHCAATQLARIPDSASQ